jgi:hypothetical protein
VAVGGEDLGPEAIDERHRVALERDDDRQLDRKSADELPRAVGAAVVEHVDTVTPGGCGAQALLDDVGLVLDHAHP